jgi:hypothetical protein
MKVYKDATAAKKLVQLHEFIELLPPNFRAGGPFHLKKGLIVKYVFLKAQQKILH